MALDYLFGRGVGAILPLEQLTFSVSKKTGRTRSVLLDGRLLGTMRSDGGIALTCFGAEVLLNAPEFKDNCVIVTNDVAQFVSAGKSVFRKHVVECGKNIRPTGEVAVLDEESRVLAVGRARCSSHMIQHFKTGVAVKVRKGVGGNGD